MSIGAPKIKSSSHMFWIDMETSSLDYSTCHIFEVFVLVTDRYLQPIDSIEIVIHHDPSELTGMSSWASNQHRELLHLVYQSTYLSRKHSLD